MIIRSLGADVPYRYNKGPHQLSKDRRVEIVPVYNAPVAQAEVTPAAEPVQEPAKVVSTSVTNTTKEVVRPGSRLAQIARRHYNEPEFWIFIYEANRDKIKDPSNLPVGMELTIPNLDERCPGMTKEQKLQEANKLKQLLLNK